MVPRCSHCGSGYPKGKQVLPDTAPALSPEMARLLGTNDPPSSSQEQDLRRIRVDDTKRIAALDITIRKLRQALGKAVYEQDALVSKVEHHRLVLNPVRRLPADVLREIFLFACARSATNPSHFYLIRPTWLSAVCRSWNDITVTFPQLWRQCRVLVSELRPIRVNNPWAARPSGHLKFALNHIQVGTATSISRAAFCPLRIDLDLRTSFLDTAPSYILLLSVASRIQHLRICTRDIRLCEGPEFRLFARRLTSLESMDLCTAPNLNLNLPATFPPPRTLQHLTITPYEILYMPGVDLNWGHLESLVIRARHIDVASARSTLTILAKVRNLHCLTFSDDCEGDSNPASESGDSVPIDGVVIIAHLTDLIIECATPALFDVLANIRAPSLECLVIRGCSREILPRVAGMLQTSACTLQRLTLQSLGRDDTVANSDGVHSFIRQCSSLRELSLLDMPTDTHCVAQLFWSLESLVQLRVLALDISKIHNLYGATKTLAVADGVLGLLESRRLSADIGAPHAPLEEFTLHAPVKEVFDFTEGQYQRIEALRASGLVFYICRYNEQDSRFFEYDTEYCTSIRVEVEFCIRSDDLYYVANV